MAKRNKTTEINIWWEGPLSTEELLKLKEDNDIGIYQVYGAHHIYGSNVLIYIGRTTEQSFGKRLYGRNVLENNQDSENIEIYVGRIFSDYQNLDEDTLKDQIKWAEALLIQSHAPAQNASNISGNRAYYEIPIHIFNYNNYRDLLPEVSSQRWYGEFRNIQIVKKIAEIYDVKLEEDENYTGIVLKNDIWFGIDEEVWRNKQVPLSYGVAINSKYFKRFKQIKKGGIEYRYKSQEYENYYFIPVKYDNDKNIDENIESIKNELDEVINLLNSCE